MGILVDLPNLSLLSVEPGLTAPEPVDNDKLHFLSIGQLELEVLVSLVLGMVLTSLDGLFEQVAFGGSHVEQFLGGFKVEAEPGDGHQKERKREEEHLEDAAHVFG